MAIFLNRPAVRLAVIFDADGVLYNSEGVYSTVVAAALEQIGHTVTPQALAARFAGVHRKEIWETIRADLGDNAVKLTPGFITDILHTARARLHEELRPAPYTHEALNVLEELGIPVAVASNSDLKVLTQMLESTSLLGRFTGRIVSAEEKRPKPAPDVYLAAASLMTVSPKDCLAVEDSVSGAQAAAEAGMDVAAFTGIQTHGKAYEQKLREAGAKHHLRTMQDLPSLAASLHLRRTLTAHGIAASRVIVSAAA